MKILALGYLFVALGGALGAVARFALNLALQRDTNFPWGTLASNLLGCLVMGVVAYLVAHSFTTLSSLVLEMNTMLQKGSVLASFSYFAATMIGSFVCFYAGYAASKAIAA